MRASTEPDGNAFLQLDGVSKTFGDFHALVDVDFTIAEGEFICFLGPSGCGKTTLLRCIAGLETQSEGRIRMGGEDISWLPTSERDFGIVFQSYALFPNLTVSDNVAYGLVNKGMAKPEIKARVAELLGLVDLSEHISKYPGQLSGGEQQRVALARALATSPGLLLLDEPLSALDAKVRAHLRREIRAIQDRLGVTTIMVTHDQEEAQTMADRIFVMNNGRIEQLGTPDEIYNAPATPFVADFIGVMNFFTATVAEGGGVVRGDLALECFTGGHGVGTTLNCAVRPEDIRLIDDGADGGANTIAATVDSIEFLGSFVRLYLDLPALGESELRADVRKEQAQHLDIAAGSAVKLRIPPATIRLYEAGPLG